MDKRGLKVTNKIKINRESNEFSERLVIECMAAGQPNKKPFYRNWDQ